MFKYRMSVIVPVYNCEDYLASCLDSLLRQTISKDELEVLLIDDGSKDGSLGICKEYAEKHDIFKVFSLENGGVSATSMRRVSIYPISTLTIRLPTIRSRRSPLSSTGILTRSIL